MVLALCLPALLLLSPPPSECPRSLLDFRLDQAPDPGFQPGWVMPAPPDPPLVKGRAPDDSGDGWDAADLSCCPPAKAPAPRR